MLVRPREPVIVRVREGASDEGTTSARSPIISSARSPIILSARSPIISSARSPNEDAWALVERAQRKKPGAGWIIPQPAHSALSGDIAAHLSPEHFPGLTPDILKAIALHDTGWSAFDAQQIESLRQQKDF